MPELPRATSRPSRPRSVALCVAVVAALIVTGSFAAPAAAADVLVGEPVASPTRGGAPKGGGEPAEAEATGRLIVAYRDGVTAEQRGRVRSAKGLRHVADVALPSTELVEPAAGGTAAAIAATAKHPDVAYVEPEYRRTHLAGPTGEPMFGQQWALRNTGQTVNGFPGVPDVDMNVPEAWAVTTGSPSVIVAVIDDGVDFSHPELAARKWVNGDEIGGNGIDDDGNGFVDDVNGYDFCNNDASVFDSATDAHGTHVAGSIAASGNGAGIAGIAPGVKIMAIKFLSGDNGSCGTDAMAIAAINYAVANGARIINASWGGYGYSQSLRNAIAASGALMVAAAGNDNNDNDGPFSAYPASYDAPNILSIASIHNEGHLTDSTNYGATSVDLSAPGEDILSTLPGGAYGLASGTSMAAANASGVAALAASARSWLLGSPSSFRAHLIRTARALPSTLGWVAYPRLLDARTAVVSRPDIVRLSGSDRYATAAAISKATFVPHVPYLFVATGRSFPDALSGGALAAQLGVPLLLVSTSSIPAPTLNEIKRLKPVEIYVLGGPAVVSESVVQQLRSYDDPGVGGTYRLAGADRFATAAAISHAAFAPGVPTVFIATGGNFPDALAGAPATAVFGGPLLLVTPTSIPNSTKTELQRLKAKRIVILGGTAVVSSTVAGQLKAFTAGPVTRWSGADRFATAATISAATFPSSAGGIQSAATAFIASGLGFPDALAGGPSAGASRGPLLLAAPTTLPSPTRQELVRLKPVRIFVLGGSSVVSDSVVGQVRQLFP